MRVRDEYKYLREDGNLMLTWKEMLLIGLGFFLVAGAMLLFLWFCIMLIQP